MLKDIYGFHIKFTLQLYSFCLLVKCPGRNIFVCLCSMPCVLTRCHKMNTWLEGITATVIFNDILCCKNTFSPYLITYKHWYMFHDWNVYESFIACCRPLDTQIFLFISFLNFVFIWTHQFPIELKLMPTLMCSLHDMKSWMRWPTARKILNSSKWQHKSKEFPMLITCLIFNDSIREMKDGIRII